ncbi:MAG: S-layer homology domain-containing protein, partial [Thermodesulfovibrionales bacterium]|nr:S-layer homology domain-containing protein [Thermodesulfovibrionales bacterium]
VDENGWSYFHINRLFKNSITYGCDIFRFCPNRFMTRGEASAFIIRAKFGEEFTYSLSPFFVDVGIDNIFFKYVQKLKFEGITKSEGIFFIDNYITRGEMSALLVRSLFGEEFTYPLTPYFSDVPPNHPFFKYIQKLKYEGFTTMGQFFDVDSYLTREQAAAFISRMFTLLD